MLVTLSLPKGNSGNYELKIFMKTRPQSKLILPIEKKEKRNYSRLDKETDIIMIPETKEQCEKANTK